MPIFPYIIINLINNLYRTGINHNMHVARQALYLMRYEADIYFPIHNLL